MTTIVTVPPANVAMDRAGNIPSVPFYRWMQDITKRAGGVAGTAEASWGNIVGSLSAQADISAALGGKAPLAHTQPASTISDSTPAGRAILTAADVASQRAVLELGTAATTDATDYAPIVHTHPDATTSAAGFMSAADKTSLDALVSGAWSWLKLASSSTVSTVAFANVAGMSFTAAANTTYLVDVIGAYQTAATTTGIAVTLDIPSGSIIGINVVSTSATALGGTEVIADAASTGATTGVRAANTNTPILARFVVAVGATGGTVQLMQRSAVAASNTVLQAGLTVMGYRAV